MRGAQSADAGLASYPGAFDGGSGRERVSVSVGVGVGVGQWERARAAPMSGATHQRIVVCAVHRHANRACGHHTSDFINHSGGGSLMTCITGATRTYHRRQAHTNFNSVTHLS